MTVQWNTDANNESILLIVEYMPDESPMRDSTLPGTPYRWKTITEDDGPYTVNTSDLSSLPVGGLLQVILARGASKKSGTSSHPFWEEVSPWREFKKDSYAAAYVSYPKFRYCI